MEGEKKEKDLHREIRAAMKRAGFKQPIYFAERLSQVAGRRITVRMLYDWTAKSSRKRFPLSLLAPFCEVVGDDALALAAITDDLRERAALGDAVIKQRDLARRIADQASELSARAEAKTAPEKPGNRRK